METPKIGPQDPSANKLLTQIANQDNTVVYPRSTLAVTTQTLANNVTITESISNDNGDIVTVYTTRDAISVTSVDQTINKT